MSKFGISLYTFCSLALLTGCTGTPVNQSRQNQGHNTTSSERNAASNSSPSSATRSPATGVAQHTPDLKGGPEKHNRTVNAAHISQLSSKYPEVVFYHGSRSVKEVALTFDDGPDDNFTPKILDILDRYHVKATFFIVGVRAAAHPEMVRRIANNGHAVGNHSWDHPDLAKISPNDIRSEITHTNDFFNSLIGYRPDIFRPPYGLAPAGVVEEIASMKLKIVDWSVDTRDWAGTPTPQIMNYVRKEVYPGGIILEHCAGGTHENLSNTVAALPQIISSLSAQGYRFVTIPALLNVPASIK